MGTGGFFVWQMGVNASAKLPEDQVECYVNDVSKSPKFFILLVFKV